MAVRVLQGHVLDVLAGLEAQSAHMVCTSPPYFQARAYGTPPQTWADGWLGELGREPLPEQYISHMVDVFRAVRRVLRDDGCCFVNLGDSYWTNPGGQNGTTGNVSARAITANTQAGRQDRTSQKHDRLKPGDLVGIPWRVAFALQADGWVLRSAITWVKLSPMPESVSGTAWQKCRVKVAQGKSPMRNLAPELRRENYGGNATAETKFPPGAEWADCPGCPRCSDNDGLVLRRGSGRPTSAYELIFLLTKNMGAYYFDTEAGRRFQRASDQRHGVSEDDTEGGTRNLLNYQSFPSEPSKLAHFAGFPTGIPRLAISCGTSERGVCPTCGSPWARVIDREPGFQAKREYQDGMRGRRTGAATDADYRGIGYDRSTTLGWRPTCPPACHQGLPPRPAVVLDCFSGSGTTLMVADRLGRDAIGVELKSDYAQMARRRVVGDAPLFAEVTLEGAADGAAPAPTDTDPLTKQERHPNRTVFVLPPRVEAGHGAIGMATEGAAG